MFSFEVLPGLPPYGDMPQQFSVSGHGTHREGFVVAITFDDGHRWVGNFQGAWGRLNTAVAHPNGADLIVVARGQGYVASPRTRQLLECFGADLYGSVDVPAAKAVAFYGFTDFYVADPAGIWCPRRLAWDGFGEVRVVGDSIVGTAGGVDPDEESVPFRIEVQSRRVQGGAYPTPERIPGGIE